MVDLADLIYVHSEYYWQRQDAGVARSFHQESLQSAAAEDASAGNDSVEAPSRHELVLFGEREGRIALANRRKDPLFLFASLHRQLGYPEVPRPRPEESNQLQLPQIARRLEQLEMRIKLVEEEQRGGIDITKFYVKPDESGG
jgi:hypothetical protein